MQPEPALDFSVIPVAGAVEVEQTDFGLVPDTVDHIAGNSVHAGTGQVNDNVGNSDFLHKTQKDTKDESVGQVLDGAQRKTRTNYPKAHTGHSLDAWNLLRPWLMDQSSCIGLERSTKCKVQTNPFCSKNGSSGPCYETPHNRVGFVGK